MTIHPYIQNLYDSAIADKADTYIRPDTADKVIIENVHQLTDEQRAIILAMFPQSKFRNYHVGPIPFDEEEWFGMYNVIQEVEDFSDCNLCNKQEVEYFYSLPNE